MPRAMTAAGNYAHNHNEGQAMRPFSRMSIGSPLPSRATTPMPGFANRMSPEPPDTSSDLLTSPRTISQRARMSPSPNSLDVAKTMRSQTNEGEMRLVSMAGENESGLESLVADTKLSQSVDTLANTVPVLDAYARTRSAVYSNDKHFYRVSNHIASFYTPEASLFCIKKSTGELIFTNYMPFIRGTQPIRVLYLRCFDNVFQCHTLIHFSHRWIMGATVVWRGTIAKWIPFPDSITSF